MIELAARAEEELARRAEAALERAAAPAAAKNAKALREGATANERRRLARLAGRLLRRADSPELAAALGDALGDDDRSVRRAAASALGRVANAESEAVILAALARETDESAKRAMIEALGKLGGSAARAALDEMAATHRPSTAADAAPRARLLLARDAARTSPSSIDLAARLPKDVDVVLHARSGLEPILLDELAALSPAPHRESPLGPHLRVALAPGTAPEALLAARPRTHFGFALAAERLAAPDDLADAIARSVTSPDARAILGALTRGPLRVRLAWASGGKRRATLWRAAGAIAARATEVVNDPRESPWEAVVHEADGEIAIELVPRFDDPRFAYRSRDVPAASHPTIAAALARVAGTRNDDVVWDPFCGSALELCERARLGPYARIIGSDVDAKALEAARANLDAAGAPDAELHVGDALTFTPSARPTLVITNPPLGRRVARGEDLGDLLESFVDRAASLLAPGGRMVWLSPFPARTAKRAVKHGLKTMQTRDVDLGGFTAGLQVFAKKR